MEVLPHQYLVRTLEHHPATLFGAPILNYHHPITVDYGQPCIFFPKNHPLLWFPHYGPTVAVHVINVAPSAAGDSFTLPPLAASLMLQPVNHPALNVVPLSSLWVTIPAFFDYRPPVLILDHYVPQVLGPPPPAWVLGPPPPVRVLGPQPVRVCGAQPVRLLGPPPPVYGPPPPVSGPPPPVSGPPPRSTGPQQALVVGPGWVIGPPVRVIGRPTRRTVYIKFVAGVAPITGAELDLFFRERVNHQEHIVEIRSSPEDGEAFVTFSRPAAVERMFNDDLGREIQFQIDGKFFWAYPQLFWNDTGSNRRALLRFELGEAPSVEEVYSHFNTGNPETQRVASVKFENREMPYHGHLYFYTSAAVQQLLQGKSDITLKIGGKNITVMKYVPKSQRSKAMQDVPH